MERVGASHWYCLHPVQHSWLNDHLVPTLLPHRTPDIFIQLVHPHCVLLFISEFISPSLCRELPRYLNSVTCGSLSDCIAFHSGTCSLSSLLTLSFLYSPRLPFNAPVPTPARLSPLRTAPHHPRTPSAEVLLF